MKARATKCYIPATDLTCYPALRIVPTRPSAIAPHSPMESRDKDGDSAPKTWYMAAALPFPSSLVLWADQHSLLLAAVNARTPRQILVC